MRTFWSFRSAGELDFGVGAAQHVGELLTRERWSRVFLVTDKILVGIGLVDRIRQLLHAAKITVETFDGGVAEPSIEHAMQAIVAATKFKPDCVLGLGGGSNMDLAKIVAIVLEHGADPRRYIGFNNVPGQVKPLVCLPTTAGTGSEVSHAAVLTDTDNQMKVSTLSQYLRPRLAIVDPELTYSCPPKVTADSGIDALTHAIEAYTATNFRDVPGGPTDPVAYQGSFPLGATIAEKAILLVGEHLVAAVRDGQNKTAREGMALASTLAGIAFSNCAVALVHALEYPLGGALHCSHGAGNGLLLPYVMRFNLPTRQNEFATIARLLGESTNGLSAAVAAERAIAAVERLRSEIGIPARIREIKGQRDQLPAFAEKAFAIKRLRDVNPRVATCADLLAIYEAAF